MEVAVTLDPAAEDVVCIDDKLAVPNLESKPADPESSDVVLRVLFRLDDRVMLG